jgi:zinc transport system ATP-binding protein
MPLALELRDVSFSYGNGPPVLRSVDLAVERGELVAIAGPNGGGKTTLLRVALGIDRPTAGSALLFGEPASRFGRRALIGYLPQRAQLSADAPATVREVVSAGRVARRGLIMRGGGRDRLLVAEAIARVGLSGVADRRLSRLSGGQQQRTFIAKALAGEPELLVLDEPTAGVDVEAQEELAALLAELHTALGVTILYVSHEFGAIERFIARLVLVRGRIVFDGPPSALESAWHDPSHVHL